MSRSFSWARRRASCLNRVRALSFDTTGPNPRHVDLWQKRATAFSGMALVSVGANGLSLGTEHPRLTGTVATSTNLLDILEVTPLMEFGP